MAERRASEDPGKPLYPSPPTMQVRIPQTSPLWTYILLAINVVAFLASLLIGHEFVLGVGAKLNSAIVNGEIWRLLTAMFLHVDLLHIAFNGYALFIFGPQVERTYGRTRFLILYLLSGLAGSALSFLMHPAPSVGASGAIFGLIGVLGAYLYRYRDRLTTGRSRLMNLIGVILYNLLYGFLIPFVDNWGHIGGLLAGLVLGWTLAPRYEIVDTSPFEPPRLVDRSSASAWLWGIVGVSLGIALVVWGGLLRWGF